MEDLSTYIPNLLDAIKKENEVPVYSSICFIERPKIEYGNHKPAFKQSDLVELDKFSHRFEELLSAGYAWINVHIEGVWRDKIIVFVDYPRQPGAIHVPRDKVFVNIPQPSDREKGLFEWDASKKYEIS